MKNGFLQLQTAEQHANILPQFLAIVQGIYIFFANLYCELSYAQPRTSN